jgi:flagellar assembly protein FliH
MARVIKGDTPDAMAVSRAAVLKLADFAAEARDIVLEARKDAARILGEAQGQADDVLADAERRGYDEGFARGKADGHAEGQLAAESHRAPAELLELARRAVDELHRATEQLPRHVLAFAVEIAEKIVGEVAGDIRAARANLIKVLALGGGYREVTIQVNPGQLAQLQEHCREVVEALSFRGTVHLVGDESIAPGGANLISGQGQIDATIATQWNTVVHALLPERQAAPTGAYQPEDSLTDVLL